MILAAVLLLLSVASLFVGAADINLSMLLAGGDELLLSPDGRRLSKRDKDLDLGYLRQNMTPEELIGILACSSGLIDKKESISARELAAEFTWDKLKKEDIYLTL